MTTDRPVKLICTDEGRHDAFELSERVLAEDGRAVRPEHRDEAPGAPGLFMSGSRRNGHNVRYVERVKAGQSPEYVAGSLDDKCGRCGQHFQQRPAWLARVVAAALAAGGADFDMSRVPRST